jgi:hypothetical protein
MKYFQKIAWESCFRINNLLVPINECKQDLPSLSHVEGAIKLTIGNSEVITLDMWDCVDQLWAYIITGVESAKNGVAYVTYFPDQPIQFSLTPSKNNFVVVRIEAVETVEKSVDAKSFYLSACEACIEFFLELKRVAKVLNSSQKNYLILAEKIKSELND